MHRNLRLTLLREIPDDANLRKQWNALVMQLDQPQIFYTWEWAFAVQKAYASSLTPLLFLAYDEQRALRGIVALATDASGKRGSFLSATTGDYCDFLSSPEDKPALLSEVLAELQQQGIYDVVLTNLPADSDTVTALRRAAQRNHFGCFIRLAYECTQVRFSRLERGTDGKPMAPGQKRIRRFAKAMAGEGKVEFDHLRSWAVEPLLSQFTKAHIIRFLEIGRVSNLADTRRRTFLAELSRLLSTSGWVVLSRMRVGERVFAWHYGFQFNDNWFWYQPTFDSTVEKHWPGFCLLTQVIQDAIENPALTQLDLGLGSEAYKAKFANATRRTLYITLHRSLPKHWQEIVHYRVAQVLKKRPQVERSVRSLLERYKALWRRAQESGWLQTGIWTCRRVLKAIAARDEVRFYEFFQLGAEAQLRPETSLAPIDMDLLARAAMQHSDEETHAYLVRCARRLKSDSSCAGFALIDSTGKSGHFTWARPFEDFHFSELQGSVPPPSPGAMILFDSWTPASQRGHGFYARTLAAVVERLRQEGKRVWGFSASTNASSIRGLEKAGWRPSFSVCRYHFLGWQRIVQRNPAAARASRVEGFSH